MEQQRRSSHTTASTASTATATATAATAAATATGATTKACVECMRRKVRCNGRLPCDKCVYYEVPLCQYRPRRKRKTAARHDSAEATTAVASAPTATSTVTSTATSTAGTRQTTTPAEALVARLFPGQDPAALLRLPSHTLLALARDALSGHGSPFDLSESSPLDQLPASPSSVSGTSPLDGAGTGVGDNDHDDEGGRGWQEFRLHQQDDEVCDDVNGLSVNVHRRSYLGNSSIQAILRAMFRVQPPLQWELQRVVSRRALTDGDGIVTSFSNPATQPQQPQEQYQHQPQQQQQQQPLEEETAINAYFAHVHGIVPLLDEAHFRDQWRRGQRCDRPWLALLNMVLVLGALAFGDEHSSHVYYQRAQAYLDFELLATGCLESLQALCLLGGLYLHLKNAPNMAYTVMGMAYRIAIGLGLHRLPQQQAGAPPATTGRDRGRGTGGEGGPWRPQIRQRIWWSLFCLDTWGSMNLGRPTLGRWDPRAMTVPRLVSPVAVARMGGSSSSSSRNGNAQTTDPLALSLDCASAFCLVATKIQQRLAQPAPITTDEILLLDGKVQRWHHTLPPVLLHVDQCPPPLRAAQRILRNRYFNLRLLLLRAVLIRYAHAHAQDHEHAHAPGHARILPSALDQQAVHLCRGIACEAIDEIQLSLVGADDNANLMLVWSAVWYLYQATMVLLLSIMVDPDHADSPRWHASVETALVLLASAAPVSRAAQRSRLLVQSLLQICTGGGAGAVSSVDKGQTAAAAVVAVPASVAYPAVSPGELPPAATLTGLPVIPVVPGVPGVPGVSGVAGVPGMPGMSNDQLWSLFGLDMFTEESSTWGANELGDWPMAGYSQFQFSG
ncbi:hypothetical protein SCUCBS95973_002309 [Sporothrix curviconia]|uniref:Zn(2)-C6 fungal-type domain-containing protein n=1 Tax=Sporothrix curviconia TaxID=1260050 RepID=A0ABP0B5Y4_9PEZI